MSHDGRICSTVRRLRLGNVSAHGLECEVDQLCPANTGPPANVSVYLIGCQGLPIEFGRAAPLTCVCLRRGDQLNKITGTWLTNMWPRAEVRAPLIAGAGNLIDGDNDATRRARTRAKGFRCGAHPKMMRHCWPAREGLAWDLVDPRCLLKSNSEAPAASPRLSRWAHARNQSNNVRQYSPARCD